VSGLLRDFRGLSLIEVLVAILLIAVGGLTAASVQRQSTMSNQTARNREIASALARQLLERLERVPYPIDAGTTYAGCLNDTGANYVAPCAALSPNNPLTPQGLNAANGYFQRTWRVTQNTWDDAHDQQRATVRVRVTWQQSNRTERVEIATVKGWTR
jgi:type IV pilus modification protein PilV